MLLGGIGRAARGPGKYVLVLRVFTCGVRNKSLDGGPAKQQQAKASRAMHEKRNRLLVYIRSLLLSPMNYESIRSGSDTIIRIGRRLTTTQQSWLLLYKDLPPLHHDDHDDDARQQQHASSLLARVLILLLLVAAAAAGDSGSLRNSNHDSARPTHY